MMEKFSFLASEMLVQQLKHEKAENNKPLKFI